MFEVILAEDVTRKPDLCLICAVFDDSNCQN